MIDVLSMDFFFESDRGIRVEGICDCGGGFTQNHESHKHEVYPENLALMQFTGLLDKNGKEIYEGDVVRCDVGDDREGCPHVIEYVMDIGGEYGGGLPGFALRGLLRNGGKGYAWTGREEVIGNVYENPELLKV